MLAAPPSLRISGVVQQGGFAFGRTAPRADLWLDEEAIGRAGPTGLFVIGFDRDAGPASVLRISTPGGSLNHNLAVAPGTFDVQRISGLPDDQVSPSDPALLARLKAQNELKQAALASRIDTEDFRRGFAMPLPEKTWRRSARFGGQRILNGEPKRPHYGTDLAAPKGTSILAPADGTVSMAATGMHFEGGLTMIDHGQGLVSIYLHQSKILVRAGERVVRGQKIGEVGATGRATGPHLCWRMTWRGRHMDPMLLVGQSAPA